MEARLTGLLLTALVTIVFLSAGSCENDLFFEFCGTWRHGKAPLSLRVGVSTGCGGLSISANESSLSISGTITAECRKSDVISLSKYGLESEEDTDFCLHWQPLLDQLTLQVGSRNFVLCQPARPQNCCTDLSHGGNLPEAEYGIVDGRVRDDVITHKLLTGYNFSGLFTDCKKLCEQANMSQDPRPQTVKLPCAEKSELEMKTGFTGFNITSKLTPSVYIPPKVKPSQKISSKVTVTFFKNNSLFQEGYKHVKLLNDVVEITVENEIIVNLTEPIRMGFNHDIIPKNYLRRCVSWDTRKDPWLVNWLGDGCKTSVTGAKHTECQCYHLTYFTVLVQPAPRPVRHLLVLTSITLVGCAVSFISCVAVIVFFFRNRRRSKEQSIPIHLGLALSLASLSLLFFFTGVLANVGGECVCTWVGAILHYATLSSLTWMGIEVFHTFWLVHMVFRPPPKPYVWNLIGFGLPVIPVGILAAVGGVYGLTDVVPADDIQNPYRMCWMKTENQKAFLAICFTNMTVLAILVFSGSVMLFLVYQEIRTRDEWKQNRVAFLSIWGLSCLFGTTWGLAFLNFGPLADFVLFLSCILNSFQGFFLMVRFCMLDWIRKQANGSVLGSNSSGSTRQHMLQASEKS